MNFAPLENVEYPVKHFKHSIKCIERSTILFFCNIEHGLYMSNFAVFACFQTWRSDRLLFVNGSKLEALVTVSLRLLSREEFPPDLARPLEYPLLR